MVRAKKKQQRIRRQIEWLERSGQAVDQDDDDQDDDDQDEEEEA